MTLECTVPTENQAGFRKTCHHQLRATIKIYTLEIPNNLSYHKNHCHRDNWLLCFSCIYVIIFYTLIKVFFSIFPYMSSFKNVISFGLFSLFVMLCFIITCSFFCSRLGFVCVKIHGCLPLFWLTFLVCGWNLGAIRVIDFHCVSPKLVLPRRPLFSILYLLLYLLLFLDFQCKQCL